MKFKELPSIIPLYAAEGMILLPRAQLTIIFEDPEEKAMINHAIRDKDRLVGLIQPTPDGGHYQKGCVGRIMSFHEGPRIFVTLGGICRFNIEEVIQEGPIKKARVTYSGFESDMMDITSEPLADRPRLLNLLKEYLEDQEISANWDEIDHASDDLILNSLSMACPFESVEKQALLETSSLSQRCEIMIALMEMSPPFAKGGKPMIH